MFNVCVNFCCKLNNSRTGLEGGRAYYQGAVGDPFGGHPAPSDAIVYTTEGVRQHDIVVCCCVTSNVPNGMLANPAR